MKEPQPKPRKLRAHSTRLQELQRENAELRARLGAEPTSEEYWARHLPQEVRDQMAARALVQEWGDEPRALLRLGFECPKNATKRWMPEVWELAHRIFGTPGVQNLLKTNLADIDAQKGTMLARLMQIAQHGDDSNAVKAATQLAKVMGLNKADANALIPGVTVNLFQMMGSADVQDGSGTKRVSSASEDLDAVIDADEFLVHEPGEATLIEDEEPARLGP